MQPSPVPLQTNGTSLDQVRQFFEGLASLEVRLAVSVGLVLLTLLVGALVAPRIVRALTGSVQSRMGRGRWAFLARYTGEYVPTTLTGVLVRAVQLTLVLTTVVALLLVWGLIDLAVSVLVFVGDSIPFVFDLGATVLLVILAYVAADLLEDTVAQFSEGAEQITDHQQEIIVRVGHLGILALAVTAGLTLWGIDLSGLIVGAGFLGIVVGLAARQTLGSMIAGFVLMFSRPFTIGDWVDIGDQEGIVTDITIFNTRLENFDGEFVVIPNDIVGNQPITNRSRKGHLRIRQDVGVDYDADPDHASEVALDAMADVEEIEQTPPPQVIPKEFGDSAVVLELRFWIDRPTPPRKWQATGAVVRAVKAAFDDEDVTIPFPQRQLSARADSGGFPVQGEAMAMDVRQPADDAAAVSGEKTAQSSAADGESRTGDEEDPAANDDADSDDSAES
ncbi:mechanosensitive ion channel family protein [Halobacteriales archaeon Cl-PHB]